MINTDMSALECDLAETYQIFEMRELPLSKVALFSVGLRENSRIKQKINKINYSFDTLLLAGIVDRLSLLIWSRSKDGQKGRNRPLLIVPGLIHKEDKKIISFQSADEFLKARKELLKEGGKICQN